MRRLILYRVFLAALALSLYSCYTADLSPTTDNPTSESNRVVTLDNGQIGVYLDVATLNADMVTTTTTRVADPETSLASGWGFVFGSDPNTQTTYGDGSPLLQKTKLTINADNVVFFTFDPQEREKGPYYFRFFINLTDETAAEIDAMVSQKMISEGLAGNITEPSTFADYKHISVGLDAYYQVQDGEAPDPNTSSEGQEGHVQPHFPMSSPGSEIEEITQESLTQLIESDEYTIHLIRVGSKISLYNHSSNFKLSGVTLLNGAMRSRIRSTVVEDDGISVMHSLPLPVNLGGTVTYKEVAATSDGMSLASPIYFFPNEGNPTLLSDGSQVDVNNILEPDEEAWQLEYLSDPDNKINPTYLIIRGEYKGVADRYYKVPIKYTNQVEGTDNYGELSYDILRNNNYIVNLNSVDNHGYRSYNEAVEGEASNISYDLVLNTGRDNRNHYEISSSGAYYLELPATSMYIQSQQDSYYEGVYSDLDYAIHRNANIDGAKIPDPHFSSTGNVIIEYAPPGAAIDGLIEKIYIIANGDGSIIIECGDIYREIPIYCKVGRALPEAGPQYLSIGCDIADSKGDFFGGGVAIDMFSESGELKVNDTYTNRRFNGVMYPRDMSIGPLRVEYSQIANFDLWHTNINAETSTTHTMVFSADGKLQEINGEAVVSHELSQEFKTNGHLDVEVVIKDINGEMAASFGYTKGYDRFTITAKDISNTATDRTATLLVTMTNDAGQVKTYTINAEQYVE